MNHQEEADAFMREIRDEMDKRGVTTLDMVGGTTITRLPDGAIEVLNAAMLIKKRFEVTQE